MIFSGTLRDDTHFSPLGAEIMARIVVDGMQELQLDLAHHLDEEWREMHRSLRRAITEEEVPMRSFIALLVVLAGTAGASDLLAQNTASVNWVLITTSSVTGVLATRATSGGAVTFDGGLDVTERGLVWNSTGSPTTLDSKTEAGSGLGSFQVTMAGLSPETTYYVRAYAVNSEGTSYGREISFTTAAPAGGLTRRRCS